MIKIKYCIQFILIIILFGLFKILGIKYSTKLSGLLFVLFGPFFRSKKIFEKNIVKIFPDINKSKKEEIYKNVWRSYGRIFSEYLFIKDFRFSKNFQNNLIIKNQNILDEIKNKKEPVIFISGHFDNFELMAMQIERSGIDLAAIYRPLNNLFLNPIMENIRKKYICRKQIKKGISGTKQILKEYKNGTSIALMIDQRVSEGIRANFFNHKALTTTIPAQFVKKFSTKIVPIYIERLENNKFRIEVFDPQKFNSNESIEMITNKLNKILEDLIKRNPNQWIWTHDRWK